LAGRSTASQLEKLSRKYARVQAHGKGARPEDDEPRRYVRRRDTDDGMVKIEAVLHPEEAELVWAMLDHAGKQLTRELDSPLARGDSETSRIVADLTTSADAQCGTARPTGDSTEASAVACTATDPAAARKECPTGDSAEASAVAAHLSGLHEPDRLSLEGHHVRHWADGGETTLENACLLCSNHHRYVHEYGYRIEFGGDGRPQFRDPRGRLVTAVPARPMTPDLGWPTIREANEALEIDADSIACEWDGTPMRYGMVVDQLVTIDGLT
jgi:hypothetical protein